MANKDGCKPGQLKHNGECVPFAYDGHDELDTDDYGPSQILVKGDHVSPRYPMSLGQGPLDDFNLDDVAQIQHIDNKGDPRENQVFIGWGLLDGIDGADLIKVDKNKGTRHPFTIDFKVRVTADDEDQAVWKAQDVIRQYPYRQDSLEKTVKKENIHG